MEGNLELPRPSHNLICIVSGHGTCSELHTQAVREVEKVDAEHESVRHIVTCDHIQWQRAGAVLVSWPRSMERGRRDIGNLTRWWNSSLTIGH